jgi:hypothetical protein
VLVSAASVDQPGGDAAQVAVGAGFVWGVPRSAASAFGGELWSEASFARREGGYFVRTVGESLTGATIRRYIESHQAKDAAEDQDEPGVEQLDLF